MTRILVLSPFEPPADGIAKQTAHLVDAWEAAGHLVLVLSPGGQRTISEAEFVGVHSKVARVLGQYPRRRTWKEVIEFEPDMVFVQFAIAAMNVSCWSVRHLCKKAFDANIPVVVAYHEPDREFNLLRFASRMIYKSMARVTNVAVVLSSSGKDALIKNELFDDAVEVRHGTGGVVEVTDIDIQRVRNSYDVKKPLVLTLGFISAEKGVDVLVSAASAIALSRDNDVQFLIAGSPRKRRGIFRIMGRRDVKCRERLEDQARSLPNVDIAFSDYIANEDVHALLFVADVVVLPYRSITQSGIANLAIESRSVVVASDLPGLRSDLGDAAKYVEVGNPTAMAEQVTSLLGDENESLRQHMRDLSAERAVGHTYAKAAETILSEGLASRDTHNVGAVRE
jgi:glycosyltransferase involved in cell wall biosynthesis